MNLVKGTRKKDDECNMVENFTVHEQMPKKSIIFIL